MLSRGDNRGVGESKTLKQRRCAACGDMHVDGERSSPKNGFNLAGKCLPPPPAAGQPTLKDGSTSNGTSAESFAHHFVHRRLHKPRRDRLAVVIPLPVIRDQVPVVHDIRAQLRQRLDQLREPGIRLAEGLNRASPGRRSCPALCRPAHATATISDARSGPVSPHPTPPHTAPDLCRIGPTPSASS